MITTIETKEQQLRNGYWQSGSGKTEILILGSCRTVPYASYLSRCNSYLGDLFTIRRIDPCDWTLEKVDLESLETDERILSVLKSADIFFHEYLVNYGMFNTDKEAPKNIYQFGVEATDATIPNFNDHMILENDYVAYGAATPEDYIERGEAEIEKFCAVCELSSFPEFADYFRDNWRTTRFFWRPNHISAAFSIYIFRRMNSRFLNLTLEDGFWNQAKAEDLFSYPCTQVTNRDREGYKITW